MALNISDIINITITRETQSISQASFSTILILGTNSTITDRYKKYSTDDLAAFAAELTGGTSDPEYKAATAIAAQNPKVPDFAVGKRTGADTSYTDTLNAILLESSDFYGIVIADDGLDTARVIFSADFVTGNTIDGEINGTAIASVPFNTDQATTAADLATAIQALSDVSTAVVDGADATNRTILITGASGTAIRPENFVVTGGASQATASYTGAIEDRKDVAAWAEANKKLFGTQSGEDDIINKTDAADSDSLAAVFKAQARERTFVIYHAVSNFLEFPDAALLGKVLPYANDNDAGNFTAKFKTLAGVTVDPLTPSQRTNAQDKNCNTYEQRGEQNIVDEGVVSESEYIDIIIFADWLEAKITELVYALLKNSLKVPYTDDGIKAVKSKVQQALLIGQGNGGISPNDFDPDTKVRTGGFEVTVPLSRNVPSNDKANRVLNNVRFTAFLAGAIHKVNISGILTY
jgi:hypothetical protein